MTKSPTSHTPRRLDNNSSPLHRADENPGPLPWERGLTLDEGVAGMLGNEAGLDGLALAKAGLKTPQAAQTVLRMLRAAAQAPSAAQRKRLAERTHAALARLDRETLNTLTGPVTDRIAELAGESVHDTDGTPSRNLPSQPSVNPATGLQEFTTVSTQDPRPFSQRLKDWWQNQLPKPFTTPPINPDPRRRDPATIAIDSPTFNRPPGLLPSPHPTRQGLQNPSIPNAVETDPGAGSALKSRSGTPAPIPQVKPQPHQIFNPTGGIERNDASGEGWFGAPRAGRAHSGVDISLEDLEKPILAPIDGTISHRGQVYSKETIEKNPALARHRSVHIQGTGPYEGMKSVMFYVDESGAPIGSSVEAGKAVIGKYQGRHLDDPNGTMLPHVHLETYWKGKRIDPATVLPDWHARRRDSE